ncbi:hypothetical protein [Engelhardtia mirabilis]|uniref:Peptidase C-terminal archaeal/bacterial domain-containing protein n=1 Tax=Engelhardtia mirabilis TaxID=2528011 RepID=A0A518BGX3_9BACT|nr:hypothetical protein Pla133_13050 [Planctomycetes bacterium Pla133]QDV00566.1 hypothetical protein Pla86_13050 [Planctomycetes bacterium Pla86]
MRPTSRLYPAGILANSIRLLLVLVALASLVRPTDAQVLVNGSSVAGQITVPGEVDTWFFTASAGESVEVRATTTPSPSFAPRLELIDPLGQLIGADERWHVAAVGGTLSIDGVYTVTIRHWGYFSTKTGPYQIEFVRAPGANEGGPLPNGGSITSDLDVGDLDSYTFDIAAGESFAVRLAELPGGSMVPTLAVYDPTGALVGSKAASQVANLGGIASVPGTYVVLVSDSSCCSLGPDGSGPYRLWFVRVPGANEGGTLQNGLPVTNTLDVGDLDSYTLEMTAGDYYLLRLAELPGASMIPTLSLYDPTGAPVGSSALSAVSDLEGVAALSGTYTVLISDSSCCSSGPYGSGPYALHALTLPGPSESGPLASGGVVSADLSLGDLDSYDFVAESGERVLLRLGEQPGAAMTPTMRVFDPNGALLGSSSLSTVSVLELVVASTGLHTVVVSDSSCCSQGPNGTGPYDLHYLRLPGPTEFGLLAADSELAGEITVGDLDSYTLKLAAGESFEITLAEVGGTALAPAMTLYDPSGTPILADGDGEVAGVFGSAATAGEHTLVLRDTNCCSSGPSGSGSYLLRVVTVPGANEGGTLLDGITISDSIDLGDVDSFTLLADSGVAVSVDVTKSGATSLAPSLKIYGPSGQFLAGDLDGTQAVVGLVTQGAGIYTVVVRDGGTSLVGTGGYGVTLTGAVLSPTSTPNVLLSAASSTDPALFDIGGDPLLGPRIGDLDEPFNFALDCSGTTGSTFFLLRATTELASVPISTGAGTLYIAGAPILESVGFQDQSVVLWFPISGGLEVPNDTALVGLSYVVQGFCGDLLGGGRLSNGLMQEIGL